jgi:hypothetical protein
MLFLEGQAQLHILLGMTALKRGRIIRNHRLDFQKKRKTFIARLNFF